MPRPTAGAGREGMRERTKRQRRQEFLDVALAIVTSEGLGAVTMQRITQTVGCAEGTIYQYFPSREALMAELQKVALNGLGHILLDAQAHLDALIVERKVSARVGALALLYGAGRVWIEAETVLPREIELCRRLFTHPGAFLKDDAEAVLPVALSLLGNAGKLFDDAVAAGALAAGEGLERAVVILAGTTGVLMTADLDRWEPRLASCRPFAHQMFTDLLAAWGAKAKDLGAAIELVDELDRRGQLVPASPVIR